MSKPQQRPMDVCSGCREPKPLVNVVLGLCNTCNQRRLRAAVRKENESMNGSDKHELSAKQRDEIIKTRTYYAQWLNLMEKLKFTREDKAAGKALARKYLLMIEGDLTESGEFDNTIRPPADANPNDEE